MKCFKHATQNEKCSSSWEKGNAIVQRRNTQNELVFFKANFQHYCLSFLRLFKRQRYYLEFRDMSSRYTLQFLCLGSLATECLHNGETILQPVSSNLQTADLIRNEFRQKVLSLNPVDRYVVTSFSKVCIIDWKPLQTINEWGQRERKILTGENSLIITTAPRARFSNKVETNLLNPPQISFYSVSLLAQVDVCLLRMPYICIY